MVLRAVGLSGLCKDRRADVRERRMCFAKEVLMLSAKHWWAQMWGLTGVVVAVVGGAGTK